RRVRVARRSCRRRAGPGGMDGGAAIAAERADRLMDSLPRHRGRHPRGARATRSGSVLLAEVLEALVELLDATGRVHDALLARVERVRLRRDLDVDHRVGDTVEFDRDRKSTRLN